MPLQHSDPNAEASRLARAKQLLLALSGTFKTRNLYSSSHSLYLNALEQLLRLFTDYFQTFGNLNLLIERNQILMDDAVVYEGAAGTMEPTDIASILHRDGILAIVFQSGLELWELDTLISILHAHCVLPDDAEDDIVTALWKFNLPSILYEAADLELGASDALVFIPPQPRWDTSEEFGDDEATPTDPSPHATPSASATLPTHIGLFQITPEEREQLRKMIVAEAQPDGTDYVVDVLLYILVKHSLPEDVDNLLETLLDELFDLLQKGRFEYLDAVLRKLKGHYTALKSEKHWSAPHLARFLTGLAAPSFLTGLLTLEPPLDSCPAESRRFLKKVLLSMDDSVIATLGPMMRKTSSAALQRVLLETIAAIARRNFGALEALIRTAEDDLAGRLVFVMGFLSDDASRQMLTDLLHHKTAQLRRQALKALITRDDGSPEAIFPLIEDPDETIRKMVFQRLGRQRSAQTEMLLIHYMENHPRAVSDESRYMEICRTLGRCGSDRSIAFLQGQIFRWPFLGILRPISSHQRQGATIALEGIATRLARHLLQRTKRGFWGNLFRPA